MPRSPDVFTFEDQAKAQAQKKRRKHKRTGIPCPNHIFLSSQVNAAKAEWPDMMSAKHALRIEGKGELQLDNKRKVVLLEGACRMSNTFESVPLPQLPMSEHSEITGSTLFLNLVVPKEIIERHAIKDGTQPDATFRPLFEWRFTPSANTSDMCIIDENDENETEA